MKRKLKELMNRALRKEEGFTLVEIIVVIVIMAILAAIAVPSVLGYINDANEAKYIAEARAVYLACQVEETKYNASNNATANAGDGSTIEGKVISRMSDDGITVFDIDYAGTTYTMMFTASDSKKITATVTANDEITITNTNTTFPATAD